MIVIIKEFKIILYYLLYYFATIIIYNIDILLYIEINETRKIYYIYRFVHLHYYIDIIG